VEVSGSNIKIFVDDQETPEIDYTDTHPFICGKVGYRVCNAHVRFDNFSVTTRNDGNPSKIELPEDPDVVRLFPNPVSDELTVQSIAAFSDLCIYNANGQEVYRKSISGAVSRIDTSAFGKGLYLLKLTSQSGNCITRKFVK
jgi:hypothetical protein